MSRTYHGKRNRGRHKKATSPETLRWIEAARELEWLKPAPERSADPRPEPPTPSAPPTPERPPWLDEDAFAALVALRARLEGRL